MMFTVTDLRARSSDARQLLRSLIVLNGRGEPPEIISRSELGGYEARVEGTEGIYSVRLDRRLEGNCTCPAFKKSKSTPKFCKHMAAVALVWLRDIGASATPADLDPTLHRIVTSMPDEDRQLVLMEAGGVSREVYARLINGEWPSE
jgi:hypothetical protein